MSTINSHNTVSTVSRQPSRHGDHRSRRWKNLYHWHPPEQHRMKISNDHHFIESDTSVSHTVNKLNGAASAKRRVPA